MKSLRRWVDLISLSASAENFTIRRIISYFRKKIFHLKQNLNKSVINNRTKNKVHADRHGLYFLFFAQLNRAFYMICMREHIHGTYFFDFVAFFYEHFEVSCKGFGVA